MIDKSLYPKRKYKKSYFSSKTYVVGTQENHLNEFFWAPKIYVQTDG